MKVEIKVSGPSGCRKTMFLLWLQIKLKECGFETHEIINTYNLEIATEVMCATLDTIFKAPQDAKA